MAELRFEPKLRGPEYQCLNQLSPLCQLVPQGLCLFPPGATVGSHPQLDSKPQMSGFRKGHQGYYYEPPRYKLAESNLPTTGAWSSN